MELGWSLSTEPRLHVDETNASSVYCGFWRGGSSFAGPNATIFVALRVKRKEKERDLKRSS